jgi:hypothetical protein
MNDGVMMKSRENKTEQKNRVKTENGDFLIIDRKKQKKKNRGREKGEKEVVYRLRLS